MLDPSRRMSGRDGLLQNAVPGLATLQSVVGEFHRPDPVRMRSRTRRPAGSQATLSDWLQPRPATPAAPGSSSRGVRGAQSSQSPSLHRSERFAGGVEAPAEAMCVDAEEIILSSSSSCPSSPMSVSGDLSDVRCVDAREQQQQQQQEILPPTTADPYYLRNFLLVLRSVGERFRPLFSPEEALLLLDTFPALSPNCQKLLVRIFLRKGPWIQESQLIGAYAQEIAEIPSCVATLCVKGLLQRFSACIHDPLQMCLLLRLPELRNLCAKHKVRVTGWSKEQIVEGLSSRLTDVFEADILQAVGPCVALTKALAVVVCRLQRLFFLNTHLDFSTLFRTDMQQISFPNYVVCSDPLPIFPSREDLLRYEKWLGLAEAFLAEVMGGSFDVQGNMRKLCIDALHSADACASSVEECVAILQKGAGSDPLFGVRRYFSHEYLVVCILTVIVGLLEKARLYRLAVDVLEVLLITPFAVYRRGHWYSRLLIDVAHAAGAAKADVSCRLLEICEQSLRDRCVVGGDRLGIERRYVKLQSKVSRLSHAVVIPRSAADATSASEFEAHNLERRRQKRRKTSPPLPLPLPLPVPAMPDPAQGVQLVYAGISEPKSLVIWGRPLPAAAAAERRGRVQFSGFDGTLIGVEELVLQHYAMQSDGGWEGMHCEGAFLFPLMSLLLWEEIFSGSVYGVFVTPCQSCPLDFGTETFYANRRGALEERFGQMLRMSQEELVLAVENSFSLHEGIMAPHLSNWSEHSSQRLGMLAGLMGGRALVEIFRVLCQDYRAWSSGLPDLVLWSLSRQTVMFVEVKSAHDKLSDQQRAWLHLLTTCAGLDAWVVHVRDNGGSDGTGSGDMEQCNSVVAGSAGSNAEPYAHGDVLEQVPGYRCRLLRTRLVSMANGDAALPDLVASTSEAGPPEGAALECWISSSPSLTSLSPPSSPSSHVDDLFNG